jgi:hypothetical protein
MAVMMVSGSIASLYNPPFSMKFNRSVPQPKVKNLAGGQAYEQSEKLRLVSFLLTSFLKDKFYESESDQLARLIKMVEDAKDKHFVAKAALFARREFGMRSVTHVVTAELARLVKGQAWTKKYNELIAYRPDDMLETLAYYGAKYGKPFPNALKKGFAKKLEHLDEYSLAKYKKESGAVKMVDLVNLVHPRATPALTRLMDGSLKPAETWEVALTQAGQNADGDIERGEMKKEAWIKLVHENKLGYFALLRNLRNIQEQAPEAMPFALEQLKNPDAIKKSLVMPFRFLSALKAIKTPTREMVVAINEAVDTSLGNVPQLPGMTLIAVDSSGSMMSNVAGDTTCSQIACLFAAALYKRCASDVLLFDNDAKYVMPHPNNSVLTIQEQLQSLVRGGGTDFHTIFETANKKYDRIIILSDMQAWETGSYRSNLTKLSFDNYKKRVGADPKLYCIDLAGHGTMQFIENNVYSLAGFSEKLFDVMALLEDDRNGMLNTIESITL